MPVAYVCKDSSGAVVSVFSVPQQQPYPEGYQVVADDDGDLLRFFNRLEAAKAPPEVAPEPTLEELQGQLKTISAQIDKMMKVRKK